MKVLAISAANLRRMVRERSNIFFIFIFPLALILLIGAQFGGDFKPAVGVVVADADPIARSVADAIAGKDSLDVRPFQNVDELTSAVERGQIQAGVVIPAGMTDLARSGEPIEIGYLSRPDGSGQQLLSVINGAVGDVMAPVAAAQFASAVTDTGFEASLQTARLLQPQAPGLVVEQRAVGEALFPSTLGRFDLGAAQQLVLFTFLTAMAGSAALILTRQLGISRRMLSTPTTAGSIVLGEASGRWSVAMVQGLYIVIVTWLAFRVDWGDPLGALAIITLFSAVGAGAGMLLGATFSNEQQASGVGIVLSLGLAALGGCMLPSELFSPMLQTISHITPHAWALDGFAELVRRNGNIGDILPELGMLLVYAVVLLLLASWRLRTVITRE